VQSVKGEEEEEEGDSEKDSFDSERDSEDPLFSQLGIRIDVRS